MLCTCIHQPRLFCFVLFCILTSIDWTQSSYQLLLLCNKQPQKWVTQNHFIYYTLWLCVSGRTHRWLVSTLGYLYSQLGWISWLRVIASWGLELHGSIFTYMSGDKYCLSAETLAEAFSWSTYMWSLHKMAKYIEGASWEKASGKQSFQEDEVEITWPFMNLEVMTSLFY